MDLAFLALLGGDEDDSVCGAGTIDSAGRCILQDLDAFDIIRIKVIDAACRHSVNYVKRIGIMDGSDTADADL